MLPDFTKKIIHEGEYVIPNRQTLPIHSTPSGENLIASPPKGATPLRLNSPGLNHNDLSVFSSSPLKLGNIYGQFETSEVESLGSSPPPFASVSSFSDYNDVPKLIHKWTRTLSILCCVASPVHKLLFCGTQDGKILVYDLNNYSLTKEIDAGGQQHQPPSILTICLSRDENYLFVAGSDSLIKVFDLNNNFHCTHIIYSLVDIGDIFSIAWCDELSTVFVGAQNASILWCKLSFDRNSPVSSSNIERLPSFRYDKFFDSKGPGGSQNTLQTKHEIYRKNSSSTTRNSPHTKHLKLIETKCEDIIRFAHNGYVYCLDIVTAEIGDFHQRKYLISGGGDGLINIWSADTGRPKKLTSLANEESVLSMTVHCSLLYVGLGNSCVNVWDLTTLQLIRSFQFAAELKEHPHLQRNHSSKQPNNNNEVLSLAIYNDSIFKACSDSGLIKLAMKSKNVSLHESILMSVEEEDGIINTVTIFTIDSVTYLLSGGNKSLCLWDITQPILSGHEHHTPPITAVTDKLSNDNLLSSLKRYISYRTISKNPQLYLEDSRHCAQFLSRLLVDLGAYQTRLLPVHNGNPIVFSVFTKNDKQSAGGSNKKVRLLWYAHYDVVDATNHEADEWATDPFVMTARDGNLYARGVSDNKGPTLAAIYSVAELFQNEELSCDVVFIIEGEEECGSIGFQQAIQEHRSMIGDIDWVMLSNSYWLDDNTPCLNYGLRGVINASVTIKSDKPDRHSGVDGGVSKEPTMEMMHVLGQLMDPVTSQIQLDHFYDDILPMLETESALYEKIHQVIHTTSCTLIRKWREPSLTIHKIQVSGPNNNTVIPQVVHATISIRIVPNQDLATIKQQLINKLQSSFAKLESENSIQIDIFHEAEPWLGDPANKVYSLLYEKVQAHWQQEPLFIREGGSIPSVRFLEKCFNAPAAQIPCGQASDNAHLKDEKLRIINLFKLRLILTDTFRELGRQ
ncbi:putative di- and tripeptidase DUG2 [Spathaspora sp. JA1]|nr:putative di- and tripeptidase DUG2 [Spathaspora sp. JA1]